MAKLPSPAEPVSELRRVPIRENGEPLVDFIQEYPALYWVPRHPVFDYHRFRLARRGLADRLGAAAAALPPGMRLAIVECWRPLAIQQQMHRETERRMAAEHPQWPPLRLRREVNRFSAPISRQVPPPHSTGGAVDLHLADEQGRMLDHLSPYSLMDPQGALREPPGLSPEAARNRALLREVLESAGLTNYPSEWWHWSYGDQGWAYRGGHPTALYDSVQPEDLDQYELTLTLRADPGFEEPIL